MGPPFAGNWQDTPKASKARVIRKGHFIMECRLFGLTQLMDTHPIQPWTTNDQNNDARNTAINPDTVRRVKPGCIRFLLF